MKGSEKLKSREETKEKRTFWCQREGKGGREGRRGGDR